MIGKNSEYYMTRRISNDLDTDTDFGYEIGIIIGQFTRDDWGLLCEDDCKLNELAKKDGGRILGAYNTSRGKVYVITDDATANPQITTVLYADEY